MGKGREADGSIQLVLRARMPVTALFLKTTSWRCMCLRTSEYGEDWRGENVPNVEKKTMLFSYGG
jgi:hypothetical protein